MNAYELFKKNNISEFFILTQRQKLSVYVNDNIFQDHSIILSFDGNSYEKFISEFASKNDCERELIQVFQDNSNLDPIDPSIDLKRYHNIGLRVFTFPINVQLIYSNKKTNFSFKFNRPIIEYIPEIAKIFQFQSQDCTFKINNEKISIVVPIHSILEKYNEQISIEIDDIPQKKNYKQIDQFK